MSRPGDERLQEVFNILERYIEDRWGIPVIIRDVPSPFTGDLDGAEIHVDYEEDIEGAVFIIAHLFGHTVQWNTCADARKIGSVIAQDPSEEQIQRLVEYEQQGCRYSMQLLHDAGIHDLDQWLSDFAACDLGYLTHFYRTGEKKPFRAFWRDDQPIMEPLEIPEFHPTRWFARGDGIVI
jgi:hypothetical protein